MGFDLKSRWDGWKSELNLVVLEVSVFIFDMQLPKWFFRLREADIDICIATCHRPPPNAVNVLGGSKMEDLVGETIIHLVSFFFRTSSSSSFSLWQHCSIATHGRFEYFLTSDVFLVCLDRRDFSEFHPQMFQTDYFLDFWYFLSSSFLNPIFVIFASQLLCQAGTKSQWILRLLSAVAPGTFQVLHRDLKSENVFLTKDQIVKLGLFMFHSNVRISLLVCGAIFSIKIQPHIYWTHT